MAFSLMLPPSPALHLARKPLGLRPTMPIRCFASAAAPTQSPKPKPFDLRTYWATLIAEINQKLDEAIPVQYPARIYEAMRYSVLAEGAKRAPPVMCVTACELFGGDRLAAFPTACALEMVSVLDFSCPCDCPCCGGDC